MTDCAAIGDAFPGTLEAHKIDSRGIFVRGAGADVREGVKAFLEKRAPKFSDEVSRDMPKYFP